ncbi:hypothetical protein [Hwanghaeella sp.]|uniref:hypothetical protein n=1 Tax=Hwanghaeella sp. TaxID=2605943 RepID=UPI003CCC0E14
MSRRKELFEKRPLKIPDFLKRDNSGANCSEIMGPGRPKGFAQDTAERTGETKQSVNRAVTRGERIAPDVLDDIKRTDMDKGVEFLGLPFMTWMPTQSTEAL